jgi:hypothetical protein
MAQAVEQLLYKLKALRTLSPTKKDGGNISEGTHLTGDW